MDPFVYLPLYSPLTQSGLNRLLWWTVLSVTFIDVAQPSRTS